MRNLFLGVCLAPYRVDLYNYLNKHFECDIYFQYERMRSQNYNMQLLLDKCEFIPAILKNRKIGNRMVIKDLNRLLRTNNPNFVFVPEFSLLTIQILWLKFIHRYKFKVICVCDDSYDMVMGNDFSKFHRLARRILTPFLDNLVVVDDKVRVWYQQNYHKGVWLPIISDEKKMRGKYRDLLPLSCQIEEEYGLRGKKVILFVGRLVGLKNVSTLIRAYVPLKEKAALVVIGDGECKEELKQLDVQLDANVIFTGRKEGDELMAWYNIADMFVLPSTQEAFGAVTNEALLAGCYSFVSEKAGSSSLIENGVNGHIFNPCRDEELTSLLRAYIDKMNNKGSIVLKPDLMLWSFQERIQSTLHEISK